LYFLMASFNPTVHTKKSSGCFAIKSNDSILLLARSLYITEKLSVSKCGIFFRCAERAKRGAKRKEWNNVSLVLARILVFIKASED